MRHRKKSEDKPRSGYLITTAFFIFFLFSYFPAINLIMCVYMCVYVCVYMYMYIYVCVCVCLCFIFFFCFFWFYFFFLFFFWFYSFLFFDFLVFFLFFFIFVSFYYFKWLKKFFVQRNTLLMLQSFALDKSTLFSNDASLLSAWPTYLSNVAQNSFSPISRTGVLSQYL